MQLKNLRTKQRIKSPPLHPPLGPFSSSFLLNPFYWECVIFFALLSSSVVHMCRGGDCKGTPIYFWGIVFGLFLDKFKDKIEDHTQPPLSPFSSSFLLNPFYWECIIFFAWLYSSVVHMCWGAGGGGVGCNGTPIYFLGVVFGLFRSMIF
jgi:hypothetical protein